jgi:ribonuclease BN (tRNA processing enzyme)
MKVQFWGTRGSIAKPGPSTARYGGNTSCIEIRSSRGTLVVIDCGTGSHGLGQQLVAENVTRGCLLIGHTHWDHIQGLPFFAPLFVPGNEWDICGPKGLSGSLRETLAGQMESTYFPVALEELGATIRYWDLLEGSFTIDDIRVTTRHLNHPALTLAYRIEADGASMVYACDHEPYLRAAADGDVELEGADLRHAEFAHGADLLIHDAQYTAAEYPAKINWGHSTIEYAMRVARAAGVSQLALTHHDPLRTDKELDDVVDRSRSAMKHAGSKINVFAAAEGRTINLSGPLVLPLDAMPISETAHQSIEATDRVNTIMLGLHDAEMKSIFEKATAFEPNIRVVIADKNLDDMRELVKTARPSVAFLQHDATHDALELARALVRDRAGDRRQMPIVIIADREYPGGKEAGISEWLVAPLTAEYAQAKVESWALRGMSHWVKAAVPDNEAQRLATLKSVGLLDTPADPRFDRITRLASRFFEVPIALVTLVDADRQWFKSCIGLAISETTRESSFCAHAVTYGTTLVVSDALIDDRFAENPLVMGQPRVRFYAGAPLTMSDGTVLGTLCILDTRPRIFRPADVEHLEDFRDLVVAEIERELLATAS